MKPTTRLLVAFLTCGFTATTAAAADLLLAINKGDNTLAIVDAATLRVLGTPPTGPDPHEVVASSDGKLAYITNYNAGNGFGSTISVVDLVARNTSPRMPDSRAASTSASTTRDIADRHALRGAGRRDGSGQRVATDFVPSVP